MDQVILEDFLFLIEVEGKFARDRQNYFSSSHGNWLPGDPGHFKAFKVWVGEGAKRINIIDSIDQKVLNLIEERCYNQMLEDGEEVK